MSTSKPNIFSLSDIDARGFKRIALAVLFHSVVLRNLNICRLLVDSCFLICDHTFFIQSFATDE